MPATDIAAKIRTTALAVIGKQCMGEDYGFDCMPMMITAGQHAVIIYLLVTTKRSPLLGQGPLQNITQIQSPSPSEADVERAVTGAMRELRELSAKMLTGQNGNARVAHTPN